MISIILMEIENPGNLGAIARVMKNFDQNNLILIDPRCKKTSQEARNRAKHANDILESAKIRTSSYLKSFDCLIATTASLGTDYNLPRSPITPEQLAKKLNQINAKNSKTKIGILIGRESSGLTNEEIKGCDFIVTIPSSKTYPTLNISHSIAILLYEISKQSNKINVSSHITPSSKIDKDIINKKLKTILNKLDFATKEKKQTQIMAWKRIFGKSFLTKREAFAVLGFLKKILEKIK
ncbi:MAG: RNA methyltransferase [Candidatus Woesearchaeota archaeon]